jgi:hypothetical protein
MSFNREATPAGETLYDPDLHLVHAAREGDTSAFEELVKLNALWMGLLG